MSSYHSSPMSISILDRFSNILRDYPGFSVFILTLVTLVPFARMGLDVTDAGFHLANQLMVGRIGLAYIVEQPYWWFSDVIGWIWLAVTESLHLGLLGARIGGILLFAACAAITVRIVSRFVLAHWLIPLSALCVAPFYSSFLSLISYDSAPAFLCLIALYLYLEAVLNNRQGGSLYLWSFFAGVVFFLLLLSRLPALTILALPACTMIVAAVIDRRYLRAAVVAGATVYAVVFILSLSFYLYLVWSGLLSKIQANQPLDTHYTADFVLSAIKAQWSLLRQWVWWFAIPSAALCVVLLFKANQRMRLAVPVFAALTLMSYGWIFSQNQLQDIFEGTLNYILLMWLLGWAAAIATIVLWKSRDEQHRSLLFRSITLVGLAICLPVIVSAGSSAGFAKLQFGSYFIPPMAVALLLLIGRLRGGPDQRMILLFVGSLLVLAIVAACHHLYARGIFRDDPDRQRLTHSLSVPKLAGIHTTPERAQSINALFEALSARPVPPGASVLVYREAPLVHYLIDDLPFRNWIWPDILPLSEIKRGLPALCDASTAPYLVVRALEPTGNPSWGGKAHIESFAPPWQVEKYEAIDGAAATCGFRSVWKNVDFEILMRAGNKGV